MTLRFRYLNYSFVLFFLTLATFFVLQNNSNQNSDYQAPIAKHGVFDMRSYRLSATETVSLDGEWEFYWDRLLDPDAFRSINNTPALSGYFPMSQAWSKFNLNGERLPATGQATFRLQLLTDPEYQELHLRLFDIHEAYKLWANGQLVAYSGNPGNSLKTEVPARSLKIASLSTHNQPVELILQVSNHHFRQGGVIEPIAIALPGTLENERTLNLALALFFAGTILFVGIYHIALYIFRRVDKAPLFFGVYCLLVVCYSVTSNASIWVISILTQWQPSQSMEHFSLACFICWASFFFRFLHNLYPDEFHKPLVYFLDLRLPIFIFLLLFFPGVPLYWFIAICLLQMMLYAGYYIIRITLCIQRKKRGAWLIQLGLVSQFIIGINDALTHLGMIDSVYLANVGISFFVLTQSFALAQRFSQSFYDVEHLSNTLELKNAVLKNEIVMRNALEQKIVNISEEERRKISHELHDGLCQKLTGARLNADALACQSKDSEISAALTELASQLQSSTDDAYKTARGLWPVEHNAEQASPSLEILVHDIAKTAGVTATFNKNFHCKKCTNPNITGLYRIAQEALVNAAKHAQAQTIQVILQCSGNGKVTLIVEDDGIGRHATTNKSAASSKGAGLGMSIMSHRAKLIGAELRVENRSPCGTRVKCIAPCSSSQNKVSNENK